MIGFLPIRTMFCSVSSESSKISSKPFSLGAMSLVLDMGGRGPVWPVSRSFSARLSLLDEPHFTVETCLHYDMCWNQSIRHNFRDSLPFLYETLLKRA